MKPLYAIANWHLALLAKAKSLIGHRGAQKYSCNLYTILKMFFIITIPTVAIRHHIPASSKHKCFIEGVRMIRLKPLGFYVASF